MTELQATKPLRYNRRSLVVGEHFSAATERDAQLLTRIGSARYATRVMVPDLGGNGDESGAVQASLAGTQQPPLEADGTRRASRKRGQLVTK